MQGNYAAVNRVLNWEDKAQTGIILFCANLTYYLVIVAEFAFPSVASWVIFMNISAAYFYNFCYLGHRFDEVKVWICLSFFIVRRAKAIAKEIVFMLLSLETILQVGLLWLLSYLLSDLLSTLCFCWVFSSKF